MGDTTRTHCRRCLRHSDERHDDGRRVGPISWYGNCRRCGKQAENDNHDQLVARRGPYWEHWRDAMARCVGATLNQPTGRT